MRARLLSPVLLSFAVAAACGGNNETSKVDGSAVSGNGTGSGGSFALGTGAGSSNGTGNGTGFGDAGDSSNNGCVGTKADGEPIPVDLFFMVDITGSMNCPVPDDTTKPACEVDPGKPHANATTRWTVESAALKAFVTDPANAGLGMGIRFFPSDDDNLCAAATYIKPAVEIGALPGAAMTLEASIGAQTPAGDTPTEPSLNGALAHAAAWAKANPTHRVAVVYSTDGYPQGCGSNATPNTIAAAAAEAAAAFAASPSIPTYVLGVGPNLSDLNTVASAGGTTKAFLIDTTQNAATQLATALGSIRTTAVVGCTYTIPPAPAGMTLQTGFVNVQYTDPKGKVTDILQDPKTDCANGAGWEYSADMTQILLCGSACTMVKADAGGSVQVRFGCATEVGGVR
jgi:hypothetical protein